MKTLALIILLAASWQALPANMSFLKNSVLTDFSKSEIADFRKFSRDSLDTIKDRKIVNWKAKSSPLSGKFKAMTTYQTNGVTCRRSRFLVSNQEKQEVYQLEICKIDGNWEIQDTALRDLSKQDMEFIKSTAELALNHQDAGIPFSWSNSNSGNSGATVPLAITHNNQKTCRELAITIFNKKGKSANGTYEFCRNNDGEWARNIKPL
jgi:surface antigen